MIINYRLSMLRRGFVPLFALLAVAAVLVAVDVYLVVRQYVKAPRPQQLVSTTNTKTIPSASITDETATWKTYRNEQFGFEVKYPETWEISVADYNPPDRTFLGVGFTSSDFNGNFMSDVVKEPPTGDEGNFIISKGQSIDMLVHPNRTPGMTLQAYLMGDKNTTTKEIIIDDQKAIYHERLRGNQLEVEVHVLTQGKEQIHFGMSLKGLASERDSNVVIFNTFLSTFKFIP